MSYDVEVATYAEPGAIEAPDGVTVDGPVAAEPDDLAEPLAAAVLAPRWLMTVSAGSREAARKLGRRIAKLNQGAAYDPQEDVVFYPRGKPKRVAAQKPETTSIVRLEWYVADERWPEAPAALVRTIARRCPEALPTRYGDFEPLQEHYEAEAFAAYARDHDTFWFAGRPSFGGHAFRGRIGLDLDWRVLDADPRWREATVDLFAAAAAAIGAFYGECWVEPGWSVSRSNRIWIAAGRKTRETALGRDGFEGLPAEPAWLAWFGGDYREPVTQALDGHGPGAPARPLRRGLRRAVVPVVDARPEGVLVRLGERPRAKLPKLPLPRDLVRPRG